MMLIKKLFDKNNKEFHKLFGVLVDQFCMSITTILTTVVLARVSTKDSYADLVLLFSICLFILGFQSAIISKPYAINYNDFKVNSVKDYFIFNLNLKYIFTLLVGIIFPIIYYFTFGGWNGTTFLFFMFYAIAHSSYFFVRETLLSERKTKQNLIYGVICSVIIISVLVYMLVEKIPDVRIFLGIAAIVYIIIAIHYIFMVRGKAMFVKNQYLDFWKVNWKLGKWLIGSNMLFHISSNIYPWLLLSITKKEDIAIFGVLMTVSSLVNPLLTALSSYLLPMFVKVNHDYDKVSSSVNKWLIAFGALSVLLLIVGIFFGQFIIQLLFGQKYENLGILVVFPFINQAINIVFQPFKIGLDAIKRTDIHFWVLIPRSIIAVSLGYLLIAKYGIIGAFYTMILENLFYQVSYSILYKRIINPKLVHG